MNGTRNLTKWTAVIACSAMLGALAVFAVLAAASRRSGQSTQSIDPTEDVASAEAISQFAAAAENVLVPQCGLAPGAVGIGTQEWRNKKLNNRPRSQ